MKKLRIISILFIVVCSMMIFAACQSNPLPKPAGLRLDVECNNIMWNPVANAESYELDINGDIRVTRNTSFNISRLGAGNYRFRVRAKSNDSQTYDDSPWSNALTYKRDNESGLAYKLINNNTEYALSSIGTWNLNTNPDVVIDSTYRGKPVTAIDRSAFSNCTLMQSVKIPNTVTSIGDRAFVNCRSLTEIELPDSLTSIGVSAFQSCESILEIEIPEGVTTLPSYLFAYCKTLGSITWSDNITSIGDFAFLRCDSLIDVTVPSGVESIGVSTFSDCKSLALIDLQNVKKVGKDAFRQCPELQSVECPKLEEIGENAFCDCAKLNNIDLTPIIRIEDEAFKNCSRLLNIELGDDLVYIGESAFDNTNCWNTEDTVVYADDWVIGFKDYSASTVELKDTVVGIGVSAFKPVTYTNEKLEKVTEPLLLNWIHLPDSVRIINDRAFYDCQYLSQVTLGPNVKSIGKYAFASCDILSDVTFSEGLEFIDSYAFYYCKRLGEDKSIDLPSTLKEIGTYAFYATGAWDNVSANSPVYIDDWIVGIRSDRENNEFEYTIANVPIKEGTVGISNYAFYKIKSITTVMIPDSLKYIGYGAFHSCENIDAITIPNNVKRIDDYAFYNCVGIKTLNLGTSVEEIGYAAFYNCAMVENLYLPVTITSIEDYAFSMCTVLKISNFDNSLVNLNHIGVRAFYKCGLESVTIPQSITKIGDYAFYKCNMLSNLTLHDGITEIGKRAFYGIAITELILPSSLVEVSDYAFRDCASLESITFNDKLESIGAYAFLGCESLTNIIFPQSLKSIGAQAFRNCKALTSIIIHNNIENIGTHAFFGCNELTIYSELKEAPEGWNTRWNSSYRPIIWNCTLSEDKTYVYSVTKEQNSILNVLGLKESEFNAPERVGHEFLGWTTANGDELGFTNLFGDDVANGTTVIASWN